MSAARVLSYHQTTTELWTSGQHLFVDDYNIDSEQNLTRTTHQPDKYVGNPTIVTGPEVWHEEPGAMMRVFKTGGLWEMYYFIKCNDPDVIADGAKTMFAYATSADGISWTRPDLGLVTIDGDASTNVFHKAGVGEEDWGLTVFAEGDGIVAPDIMAFAWYNNGSQNGYHVAFSQDGFTHAEGSPDVINGMGDIVDGVWDTVNGTYLLCFKNDSDPGQFSETRRCVAQARSPDLLSWGSTHRILTATGVDGERQYYSMDPYRRNDLYIGFARVLRDDMAADEGGPANGIGWTTLVTSRDGENWEEHLDEFMSRNLTNGTWDHAMAWFGCILTVGDQEIIYYGGYDEGHKVGLRQLGMAMLRKDGFVSRDAGASAGGMVTRSRLWNGGTLTLNAAITTSFKIRALNEQGGVYPDHDWVSVSPGDDVALSITWPTSLDALIGLPVRFEIEMVDAEFYGLNVS